MQHLHGSEPRIEGHLHFFSEVSELELLAVSVQIALSLCVIPGVSQ